MQVHLDESPASAQVVKMGGVAVLVISLTAVIKYEARSSFNAGKVYLSLQSKEIQSIATGKAWWQWCEVAGHSAPKSRSREGKRSWPGLRKHKTWPHLTQFPQERLTSERAVTFQKSHVS